MSSAIVPFDFEGNEIRAFLDENGEPQFIAGPVCKALELDNISRALARLDDDEKGVTTSNTLGGPQQLATITESGLYSLILSSRKAAAKRFKKHVTSVILPQIRKTGSYSNQPAVILSPAEQILSIAQAMVDFEHREKEREAAIRRIEARQDAVDQKGQFFTVAAYCNIVKRHYSPGTIRTLSSHARKYSLANNYPIGEVKDQRWGMVKTYHEDVLALVFADFAAQWPLLED